MDAFSTSCRAMPCTTRPLASAASARCGGQARVHTGVNTSVEGVAAPYMMCIHLMHDGTLCDASLHSQAVLYRSWQLLTTTLP